MPSAEPPDDVAVHAALTRVARDDGGRVLSILASRFGDLDLAYEAGADDVRTKRKIRAAGMPLSIPAALDERLDVVLGVLYLIFNEGYLSRSATAGPVRVDLVAEAARLTAAMAMM